MKIKREYFGGSEVIDLSTPEGYESFATGVIQDYDEADEIITMLAADPTAVMTINDNEPEFFERYTVIPEDVPS